MIYEAHNDLQVVKHEWRVKFLELKKNKGLVGYDFYIAKLYLF